MRRAAGAHGDQQHAIGGPLDAGAYPVPGAGGERARIHPDLLAVFLPDRSLCAERCAPSQRRGGDGPDARQMEQPPDRAPRQPAPATARCCAGGVRIFEYQAGMIHAKVLIIDGTWSVLGSTNFDNRSFGLNDEVNVAILEAKPRGPLQADFADDLAKSRAVSIDEWRRRPLLERVLAC